MNSDIARQKRELDQRKRALQQEAELRKRELDNAQKLQKQKDEMENLQAEVQLREQEQMADLGDNCDFVSVISTGNKQYAPRHAYFCEDKRGASSLRNVTNWLNDVKTDTSMPGNQLRHKKSSEVLATNVDKAVCSGVYPEKAIDHLQEPSDASSFVEHCLKTECLLQSKWRLMETPELS